MWRGPPSSRCFPGGVAGPAPSKPRPQGAAGRGRGLGPRVRTGHSLLRVGVGRGAGGRVCAHARASLRGRWGRVPLRTCVCACASLGAPGQLGL